MKIYYFICTTQGRIQTFFKVSDWAGWGDYWGKLYVYFVYCTILWSCLNIKIEQICKSWYNFTLFLSFWFSLFHYFFSVFKTQRGLKTQKAPTLLDLQMFPLPRKRTTRNQVVNRPSVFIDLHCDPWSNMTRQLD